MAPPVPRPGRLAAVLARYAPRLVRRGRVPGLRTAKTTLAAVLAFLLADALGTSAAPVLAPLTALLVVSLTMYQTLTSGLGRVVSVLVGVLVAVAVAELAGLTWWSLGTVVATSLVLGRLLKLGSNVLEVPISAMIVLAVADTREGLLLTAPDAPEQAATGRVVETLVGAVVGIAVNVAIAPPLYIQPAADALGELTAQMASFQRELAGELRAGWSRAGARRWLDRARDLGREVARVDRTVERTEESSRFNPRGAAARAAQPRLRTGLSGLEHTYASLRGLCRALLDRTHYLPPHLEHEAFSEPVRRALADVLDESADAVAMVGEVVASVGEVVADGDVVADPEAAPVVRARVRERLLELRRRRDRLSELLWVDPHDDEAAWEQHGDLLANVDRLRVELEAAVRTPTTTWRPVPVGERQRQALRRVVAPSLARVTPRSRSRDR